MADKAQGDVSPPDSPPLVSIRSIALGQPVKQIERKQRSAQPAPAASAQAKPSVGILMVQLRCVVYVACGHTDTVPVGTVGWQHPPSTKQRLSLSQQLFSATVGGDDRRVTELTAQGADVNFRDCTVG